MRPPEEITARLRAAAQGDRASLDEVFTLVYEELRRLARAQRRRWSGDDTLDTTALVHEAYLKLVDQRAAHWNDRAHFLAVASTAMRHVLVNYAERRRAAKRGGGAQAVSLDDYNPVSEEVADDILALHEALERLGERSERQVKVVDDVAGVVRRFPVYVGVPAGTGGRRCGREPVQFIVDVSGHAGRGGVATIPQSDDHASPRRVRFAI